MEQIIICKYWNAQLNIAFYSWHQVYMIGAKIKELKPKVHKEILFIEYRVPIKELATQQFKKDS